MAKELKTIGVLTSGGDCLLYTSCQFVDTAECRTVFGGDQVRADTPGIDCGALGFQRCV